MNASENTLVFEQNYVERDVLGTKIRFYPVTVGTVLRIKGLAGPVSQALSVLFQPRGKDAGTSFKTYGDAIRDENGKPIRIEGEKGADSYLMNTETVSEAVPADIARMRSDERASAIGIICEAILSENNSKDLVGIILNSMKRDIPTKEFLDTVPVDAMPGIVQGVIEANKGVFGPLAKALDPMFGALASADGVEGDRRQEKSSRLMAGILSGMTS